MGERATNELGWTERLQVRAVLPVVLHHQVIDADGGVAVAHIEATAWRETAVSVRPAYPHAGQKLKCDSTIIFFYQ